MVPAPSCPDKWDYWQSAPSDEVELMCLLPNSVYIPMSTKWDATLQNVKEVSDRMEHPHVTHVSTKCYLH